MIKLLKKTFQKHEFFHKLLISFGGILYSFRLYTNDQLKYKTQSLSYICANLFKWAEED